MKTKLISVLLITAMILSMLPIMGIGTVAAEEVEYVAVPDGQGWKLIYETNGESATRVANIAKGEASDGTYSLHLTNDLGSSGGSIHVMSTSFDSNAVTAGGDVKYELSIDAKNLWAKLADNTTEFVKYGDGLVAMIGWGYPDSENGGTYDGDAPNADYTDGAVVKMKDLSSRTSLTGLEDGWQRLTYILDGGTAIERGVEGFRIRVNSEILGDVYIDNISLRKMENGIATGANLIQNSSFEDGLISYETEALDTELWTVGDANKLTVAKGVAKTGDRSLHIKTSDTTNVQLKSKVLTEALVKSTLGNTSEPTKPKVANISFWMKGTYTSSKADGSDLTANIGWEWDASRLRFNVANPSSTQRPMTQVETVDGWTKYTGSFDYSNYEWSDAIAQPRWQSFFLNIECVCDIFIDDIEITVAGETTNLLGDSGTFEIEEELPKPEISYIDIPQNVGWKLVYENEDASATRVANLAKGEFYEGEYSLHLTNDKEAVIQIQNTAFPAASVENTDYELTLYVKNLYAKQAGGTNEVITSSNNLYAMIGWGFTQTAGDGGVVKMKDASHRTNWEGANDNGWFKVTYILDGARAISEGATGFVFRVNGLILGDVYIDNVVLRKMTDGVAVGDNLIENGTFENLTPSTPDPGPDPGPGPDPEPSEPVESEVMYQGMPEGYAWVPNYRNDAQSETRAVNIAIGESYTGKSSLHITNDLTSELSLPNTSFTSADIKEGVTYTLSFYIKNIDGISNNNALYAQIGWGGWVDTYGDLGGVVKVKDGGAMKQDSNTDKEGWIRVYTTFDGTVAKKDPTGFRFNINEAITDIYIDDVTLVASDDATNTNLLNDSGFELETPAEGYIVDSIKIYDGETEITDLTEASGKTLTVKTKIAVFDAAKLTGAQLIVSVYNGYEMKKANMTEVTSFEADGQVIELTTTIEMPTYAAVGDYKVKAFVWDSLTGGRALAGVKEI